MLRIHNNYSGVSTCGIRKYIELAVTFQNQNCLPYEPAKDSYYYTIISLLSSLRLHFNLRPCVFLFSIR